MKFNKKEKSLSKLPQKTVNYMGGVAYVQSPKEELANALLTSFMEDSYYESKEDRLARIKDLVPSIVKEDPVFVAKLAVYLREQHHMRSAFHVLVSELSKFHKGDSLVSDTIYNATQRVDDLIEIVSYLGKPIPNQVKKGISRALNKFDEYQLAKYSAKNKDVSLVDVFNLTHPKPTKENAMLWKRFMKGELKNTETWEAKVSSGEKKSVVFKELLQSKKLGYMACLRNLKNIMNSGDNETIELAAKYISNRKAVLGSKQLPFRFLTAYQELSKNDSLKTITFEKDSPSSVLKNSLSKALKYSCENIPLLSGKTVILTDNSGSMAGDTRISAASALSKVSSSSIANLFALLYWEKAENTFIGLFGDRLITPKLDRDKGIFENFDKINSESIGCGRATEAGIFYAFEKMIAEDTKPERVIIFSDCQLGKTTWYDTGFRVGSDFGKLFKEFQQKSPETKVYCINLRGYSNKLFSNDNVIEVSGWSNKIFDMINIAETEGKDLISQIEDVDITKSSNKN